MGTELCDSQLEPPVATTTAVARKAPSQTVAAFLREKGYFPPAVDEKGRTVDPSPLAHLSPLQRRRRLVGILEFLAVHGDGAAANAALAHARWEEEMKKGKAPSRETLAVSGEIKVVDDFRSPGETPIPLRTARRPD